MDKTQLVKEFKEYVVTLMDPKVNYNVVKMEKFLKEIATQINTFERKDITVKSKLKMLTTVKSPESLLTSFIFVSTLMETFTNRKSYKADAEDYGKALMRIKNKIDKLPEEKRNEIATYYNEFSLCVKSAIKVFASKCDETTAQYLLINAKGVLKVASSYTNEEMINVQ